MPTNLVVNSGGNILRAFDFGGNPASEIVLLHGLAGRAREWNTTTPWLTKLGRVIALDQRGHGDSRMGISSFTRNDYVKDAIHTIEQHCQSPVCLIGQSMGGLNAFLVAAERPDLVKELIVVEASPSRAEGIQQDIRNWLETWTVPFHSFDAAWNFFGEGTLRGKTYAESLDRFEDGYYAAFNIEDMLSSLDDLESTDYWNSWGKITCPTLIVTGEKGFIPKDVIEEMIKVLPSSVHVSIPKAGHDLHLDEPEEWRKVFETFIKQATTNSTNGE